MQQIWKDRIDWDENLKPETLHHWLSFLDDYKNISLIIIPRFVIYTPSCSTELHGFCDASEKAYAATLYIRTHAQNRSISSHLLLAKTKVAPVKFVTLPRKELCGAELLAKLVSSFQAQVRLDNCKLYLWTDSTIVLAWLQKHLSHWTTFVANRISFIVDKVGNVTWRHVSSKDNPADLGSRGLTVKELVCNRLWWHGPEWLSRPNNEWPVTSSIAPTDEEVRSVNTLLVQQTEDILTRFSDLSRAMRVIAYIFRFYNSSHPIHKRTHVYPSQTLSQSEINFVKLRLVKCCQNQNFPEYSMLSRGIEISKKSPLLTFNPFIDADGIMKINGRLSRCEMLSHDERFPKILPYYGRYTRLYIELLHRYTIHGENSLLIRLVRMEYWVPKLKNLIKTVIFNCKTCIIHKHRQCQQIMAALPLERTSLSRLFTSTELDFAGPFNIKSIAGRGFRTTKGYVLVFVCFSTKAIHLEATSEVSTPAFLAAFARFFSRLGTTSAIFSDNGTAFVGANNIFRKFYENILPQIRSNLLSQHAFQNISWHFNPPGAPHMGGLWEAGVKSFKAHLKKITHAQFFTFEEFTTMLTRIEACLNSRPLSPMSENPDEISALTPGHFLIGAPLLSPPEPDLSGQTLSYANRWKKLNILHQNFACRWKEEYLKELHKRNKWKFPQRNLAINDLVVIRKDNFPPTEWRLGRVQKVFPRQDNRIRIAEIRTSSGITTRPITKLILLPFSNNETS